MAWAGHMTDDGFKRLSQQAADMHAGNERVPKPAPEPEKQPAESIDWEAHRRFMRGL